MNLTSFRCRIAPVLLCATLLSCGGSKTETTTSGQGTQPAVAANGIERLPDAPLPSEFSQQESIIQQAPALRYLPASTVALALSDSAIQLAQTLESSAILNSYPDARKELEELRTSSGAGLFFPETWEKAGIDSDAQAGTALSLIDNHLVGFFFVTIKNKEVVVETLKSISSSHLISFESIGPDEGGDFFAQWESSSKTAVVVRENTLYFIIADGQSGMEPTRKFFQNAAASESMSSVLKGSEVAGFDFGAKLGGLINFPEIAAGLGKQVDDMQYVSDRVERLEESVAVAIDEGREDDAARAKEELEREMGWYRKRQLDQAGEELAIRRYLSPLGLSPVGVALDGGTSLLRAQLTASPQSELASLFTANTSAFALPARLQADPIFMIAGHFRISALLPMLEPFFYFQESTLKQSKKEFKKYSQVDFDALVAQFDGELSGALTMDLQKKQSDKSFSIGFHFLAHLRVPAEVQSILDDLAKHEALQKYAKIVQGKTVLEIPGPRDGAPIRIQVAGEFLEARSLLSQAATVEWKQAELKILAQPDSRAIMVLDPSLFGLILMVGDSGYSMDDESVPNAAIAAKIEVAKSEIKKLRNSLNAAMIRRITRTSNQFGRFVLTAQNKDGGYALLGGLFGQSANLGRAVQTLIEAIEPELEQMRTKKVSEVRTIRRQLDRLQEELYRLERSAHR